ncbi:MAG: sugar kinase, partial [bacterium]
DILALGESLIEFSTTQSLASAENFSKYYGGDALNTVITASRLGSKSGYITKIGDDYFKDFLINSWEKEDLDISNVKITGSYNGLYLISRQLDGAKEIMYYRKKSAAALLSIDDISEEILERTSIVYSTGITQSLSVSARSLVKKAFSLAGDKQCQVAYDPNFTDRVWDIEEAKEAMEEIIEYVDIIMLSSINDAEKLINTDSPDKIIKYFWDRGVPMVAVKMGQSGSVIGYNGEISTIPPRVVDVIDATGSGDTFNGGFLYGISNGYTAFESARLGSFVASEQSKGLGAIKSIPYGEQVFAEFRKI